MIPIGQVKDRLRKGSMVVLDKGGNRKDNLDRIENSKMKYLTARQLNKSDEDTWIKDFDKSKAELVDERHGVYGLKKRFPSRTNYLFFSEHLYVMGLIWMRQKREKKESITDFYGIRPKRTGRPEWATPEEIKSIWE